MAGGDANVGMLPTLRRKLEKGLLHGREAGKAGAKALLGLVTSLGSAAPTGDPHGEVPATGAEYEPPVPLVCQLLANVATAFRDVHPQARGDPETVCSTSGDRNSSLVASTGGLERLVPRAVAIVSATFETAYDEEPSPSLLELVLQLQKGDA